MSQTVLPSSMLVDPIGDKCRGGVWFRPVYCANCGKPQGEVMLENLWWAFILCDPCAAKHGREADSGRTGGEIYEQYVAEEQLLSFQRFLTLKEIAAELANPNSTLSVLARERKFLTPAASR